MRNFSLLIKPASADCNLRCEYCFYLEKCALYPDDKKHRMSVETLDKMVSSYMATPQPQYAFGWQGGEPTLMGLDFFKKVVELQQKYGRPGAVVANGLQTNAVLINDEFAEHLAKYRFLIGVSLDGPEEIHNMYRKNISGLGSHTDVLKGIDSLESHNAEFNILVLVSQSNVKRAKEVYNYLCEKGFYYHQYIPCVEFDEKGELLPFAINGEEWGNFMCEIYDCWIESDTRKVSIRHFDSVLSLLVDKIRNVCVMGNNCCQYFVVEHNGDIYPCDFFVEKDLKLGNVAESKWEELQVSEKYLEFGKMKAKWNSLCDNCFCIDYCYGDCLKHRLPAGGSPEKLSALCAGWKQFYKHTEEGFKRLADEIREERQKMFLEQQRQRQAMMAGKAPSPTQDPSGRNDLCPCGSGLKYKKCCGK